MRKLWLLLGLAFLGPRSFAYVVVITDLGPVIVVRQAPRIYKVPCSEVYIGTTPLPRNPEALMQGCKSNPNQQFESVSETAYSLNLSALYGIATFMLNEKSVLTLFSDSALASERNFRSTKSGLEAFSETFFEKLLHAHDDILSHLGPESDKILNNLTPNGGQVIRSALAAFTPHFSDGEATISSIPDSPTSENGGCPAGTGLASLSGIFGLLAHPRTGPALMDWMREQHPRVQFYPELYFISTWHPSFFENGVASSGNPSHAVKLSRYWVKLSEPALTWVTGNRSRLLDLSRFASILEIPGLHDLVGVPVTSELVLPYTVSMWCLARWNSDNAMEVAEPEGTLGIAEVARRLSLTPEGLRQWATTEPAVERIVGPLSVSEHKISEKTFVEKLFPPAQRMLGRDIPN